MESINNMASAAAKAVWGENKKTDEPVSGRTGDTSKGEPYDAGNLDEPNSTTNTTHQKTSNTTESAGVEAAKETGIAKEPESAPNNPSANLKAKDTPADTTKGQNDVRSPDDPQTHPKGEPTDVDDTGDGPNEAQKLDGPGPRPIGEVAKEHGGDAGNAEETGGAKTESAGGAPGAPSAPGTDPDDEINQKSTGEGTGEQYVKSSGLKADGGDFDATKPGAGREADRLLEEKGIHKAGGPPTAGTTESESSGDHHKSSSHKDSTDAPKEKKSLGEKIKEKLHKH